VRSEEGDSKDEDSDDDEGRAISTSNAVSTIDLTDAAAVTFV
jgi:hypothetical protein